jgi:hypothetical protein
MPKPGAKFQSADGSRRYMTDAHGSLRRVIELDGEIVPWSKEAKRVYRKIKRQARRGAHRRLGAHSDQTTSETQQATDAPPSSTDHE